MSKVSPTLPLKQFQRSSDWPHGPFSPFQGYLFSWCFEPSQPKRVISGLPFQGRSSSAFSVHASLSSRRSMVWCPYLHVITLVTTQAAGKRCWECAMRRLCINKLKKERKEEKKRSKFAIPSCSRYLARVIYKLRLNSWNTKYSQNVTCVCKNILSVKHILLECAITIESLKKKKEKKKGIWL